MDKRIEKTKCCAFLAAYAALILVTVFYTDHLPSDSVIRSYIKIPFYLLAGTAVIIFFRKDFIEGFSDWKKHYIRNTILIIGGFIGNIILANLAGIPGSLIYGDQTTKNDSNLDGLFAAFNPVLVFLVVGILGPLVEEAIFRMILINRGRELAKIPLVICVIISSILFMFIHIHSFTAQEFIMNLDKLASGLLFGIIYASTKNITLSCGIHIINNSLASAMMILSMIIPT
ncbi:MAG: CPBP family intramembrane metalloprotease [Clostridiales bacterium]|nr:CPBP family intramembrane metalloprotease [Clostridiales bacterium]